MHRKGFPHVFRRRGHKDDEEMRVLFPQLPGRPDAVRALHADIQKHHSIRPGGGSVQKCVAALVQVADDRILPRLPQQPLQPLGFKLLVFNDRDPQLHRYAPPLQLDCTTFFRPLHLPFTRETPPFTQNCPICAAKACRKTSNPSGLPASRRLLQNLCFFIPFLHFFKKGLTA
jgi:hypothetical protein